MFVMLAPLARWCPCAQCTSYNTNPEHQREWHLKHGEELVLRFAASTRTPQVTAGRGWAAVTAGCSWIIARSLVIDKAVHLVESCKEAIDRWIIYGERCHSASWAQWASPGCGQPELWWQPSQDLRRSSRGNKYSTQGLFGFLIETWLESKIRQETFSKLSSFRFL